MSTIIYAGGFEGFWTVVYDFYKKNLQPETICRFGKESPEGLFEARYFVEPNPLNAKQAASAFVQKAGSEAFDTLQNAWRADTLAIDRVLLDYVRTLFKDPKQYENWTESAIKKTRDAAKATLHEVHRWHGFTRFSKLKTGEYYATIAPKCEIMQPLATHFCRRMPNEWWILHDTLRGSAWVHAAKQSRMYSVEKADQPELHDEESTADALWQIFFKSHTIPDRASKKRQLKWVAKRFHPFMNEMR